MQSPGQKVCQSSSSDAVAAAGAGEGAEEVRAGAAGAPSGGGLELDVIAIPSRPQRMHPRHEQRLGAVDVADAGDDRLVHQEVADAT